MYSRLYICVFITLSSISESVNQLLNDERYSVNNLNSSQDLKSFVYENKEQIDCLIILKDAISLSLMNDFYEQGILLPVIIIESDNELDKLSSIPVETESKIPQMNSLESPTHLYHSGEIRLHSKQLDNLGTKIEQAITQFLHLGPSCSLSEKPKYTVTMSKVEDKQSFLLLQQRRLAEKLKERLGYLGVYYNRNPKYFYRHLSQSDKKELLEELTEQYREIILNYFAKNYDINQEIDQFVNRIFFTDLSISQVLEIHMELMDDFSQKLKLEGRSEEILLDYRLALIDIIAHLSEMYRRSIPREDLPFDILLPAD